MQRGGGEGANFPGVTMRVEPDQIDPNGFVAWVNVGPYTQYAYEVDFGEGDASLQTKFSRVVMVCNTEWTCQSPAGVYHSYLQAGTYSVRLYKKNPGVGAAANRTLITQTSVTVGAGVSGITVKKPAGGAEFKVGDQMKIEWADASAHAGARYAILLWQYPYPDGGPGYQVSPIAPNGDLGNLKGTSYRWTIPSSVSAGTYQIRVCRVGEDVCGVTGALTINGASSGSPLTVKASLEDPTGKGKESFAFGDQLVIKWSASPVSDVEASGWGIYTDSFMSIELRPYGNENATGIRIVRVAPTTVFPYIYTWNVTREGLFGDVVTPGRYYVYVSVPSKKQGGYVTGVAGPISIGTPAPPNDLKVTYPNGGETFVKGQMFAAKWTLNGSYPPGTKVCINLTNESTQANNVPFYGTTGTEHCAPVDSWKTLQEGGVSGQLAQGNSDANWLPSGKYRVIAFTTMPLYSPQYDVQDKSDATFSIVDSAQPTSKLEVLEPNDFKIFDPKKPLNVRVQGAGISTLSVALYKNDQWKYWIEKDVPFGEKDVHLVTWYTPSDAIPTIGNDGPIYKIYARGQKSGGSGYVEDKSDAPFAFSSEGPPIPPQTNPVVVSYFYSEYSTVAAGKTITFRWGSNLSSTDISYYGGGCYLGKGENGTAGIVSGLGASGTYTYTPTESNTYMIKCISGAKDGSPSASKTVQVNLTTVPSVPYPLPTCTMLYVCTPGGLETPPVCGYQDVCWQASVGGNSNLANALSALEGALKSLLGSFR